MVSLQNHGNEYERVGEVLIHRIDEALSLLDEANIALKNFEPKLGNYYHTVQHSTQMSKFDGVRKQCDATIEFADVIDSSGAAVLNSFRLVLRASRQIPEIRYMASELLDLSPMQQHCMTERDFTASNQVAKRRASVPESSRLTRSSSKASKRRGKRPNTRRVPYKQARVIGRDHELVIGEPIGVEGKVLDNSPTPASSIMVGRAS